MIENWTLRLNAGDETRIQADSGAGISLAVCDIKCGGLAGRTVDEAERMAADIVARYNAAAELLDALQEHINECFDDRCEMCARHEKIIARVCGQ
jgi:hypothetical protein